MLSYPRGYGYRGGIASRGPYRKNNQFVPELKNYDLDQYQPFYVGAGDMNGAMVWAANNSTWLTPVQNTMNVNQQGVMSPPLNSMAQNTTANGRLGTRIWCKKLYLTLVFRLAEEATGYSQTSVNFRCLLVLDKQPNGSVAGNQAFSGANTPSDPLISAIVQGVKFNSVRTSIPMPHSPLSLDNRDRFRVLYDYHGALKPNGTNMINTEKVIPLKFFTQFGSGGAIITNQLFLIFLSDGYVSADVPVPNGGESRILAKFMSRLRFTDP